MIREMGLVELKDIGLCDSGIGGMREFASFMSTRGNNTIYDLHRPKTTVVIES